MRLSALSCVAVLALGIATAAGHAADLTGRIVAITDSDTITLLDASETRHKFRLAASQGVLRTGSAGWVATKSNGRQ